MVDVAEYCFMSRTVNCAQIHISCVNDLECIVLKLNLSPQMSFIVIGMYRPPSTKTVFYDNLNALLKECDTKNHTNTIDHFNINWSDKTKRKELKRVTSIFEFQQIIEGPTRITSSSETLNYLAFTNREILQFGHKL